MKRESPTGSLHFDYFEVEVLRQIGVEQESERFEGVVAITKEECETQVIGGWVQLSSASAQQE